MLEGGLYYIIIIIIYYISGLKVTILEHRGFLLKLREDMSLIIRCATWHSVPMLSYMWVPPHLLATHAILISNGEIDAT